MTQYRATSTSAAELVSGTNNGNNYVNLTDAQTVGGVKTFSSVPSIPTSANTGSSSTDAVNVAYLHNNGYATTHLIQYSSYTITPSTTTTVSAIADGYINFIANYTGGGLGSYLKLRDSNNGFESNIKLESDGVWIYGGIWLPVERGHTIEIQCDALSWWAVNHFIKG